MLNTRTSGKIDIKVSFRIVKISKRYGVLIEAYGDYKWVQPGDDFLVRQTIYVGDSLTARLESEHHGQS